MHEFWDAGDARGDYGPLKSHGFEQHDGQPFGQAGQDENVDMAVETLDAVLTDRTHEMRVRRDTKLSGAIAEELALGAVADERAGDVGSAAPVTVRVETLEVFSNLKGLLGCYRSGVSAGG